MWAQQFLHIKNIKSLNIYERIVSSHLYKYFYDTNIPLDACHVGK